MKIISRYILKEHLGPLVFALSALTSLLLLNYIGKQFGNLVGKGLSWGVIGEFFLLSVPFTVAMTLPMAVLVSTLYAFSRLASENEVTALKASGISMIRLMIPILLGAGVLSGVMIAFNDQVLPRANHRLRVLQTDIGRKKPTFALREQVINEVSAGKLFLRAGHIDEGSNRMREVTIYDLSNPTSRRTIYADSGDMGFTADQRDLQMTLYAGHMQELPKNERGQLQRLFYDVNTIRIRDVGNTFSRDSGGDNLKSDREMSVCEMQAEVDQARNRHARWESELEQSLAATTWTAATGRGRPAEPIDTTARSIGIGPTYCALLGPLVGVAEAADPAGDDAFREMRMRDSILALTAPTMDTLAPPMAALPGTVEAARVRIQDALGTVNAYDVEIQKKFALAAACVVFVLLGAPIALRFPRGGVGLVITVSLGVFALYYVGLIAGESLSNRGVLSPVLSMWAANALFTAVGLVLLSRMGKESNTGRGGGDMREMIEMVRTSVAKVLRRAGLPAERRRRVA